MDDLPVRDEQAGPLVESVDGEVFLQAQARKTSQRMFYSGFAALPWMWAVNVWLFWPSFRYGQDPVVQTMTRRSAVGFVVWLLPFMAWMLLFMIGGASVLGETAFRWLDITQIELAKYGLA